MIKNDAPERLALKYNAAIERSGGDIIFTNPENGKKIEILREPDCGEVVVCFAAQHRHYEDLDDALDYAGQLMRDEILAIEYYAGSEPRFGGDVKRTELTDPLPATRGTIFSMLPADHPGLNYEINSWSGKYDLKYITT